VCEDQVTYRYDMVDCSMYKCKQLGKLDHAQLTTSYGEQSLTLDSSNKVDCINKSETLAIDVFI